MRRFLDSPVTLITLLGLLASGCSDQAPTRPSGPDLSRTPLTSEWVEEIFIDRAPDPVHAGPGPHPVVESSRFSLTQGGISWFVDGEVEYAITGAEAVANGNDAIEAAIGTWDGFVTTRTFDRDDATEMENPCREGEPNRVTWEAIDGAGGTVAATSVCRNVATKEIVGFVIVMDTAEPWSVTGEGDKFDVEGVASHEFGHAAGLGHVNSWRDGCLTMYRYVAPGETQKRTLGLGDKLGMNVLYSSADVAAGACSA